jgi:hypothetical protein
MSWHTIAIWAGATSFVLVGAIWAYFSWVTRKLRYSAAHDPHDDLLPSKTAITATMTGSKAKVQNG